MEILHGSQSEDIDFARMDRPLEPRPINPEEEMPPQEQRDIPEEPLAA